MRRAVIALAMATMILGAACDGGGGTTPTSPVPSQIESNLKTLHVTVNAGGDCSVAEHDFGVQVIDHDGLGTHPVGGEMSEVTMLEPGIVPCRFSFTIPDVGGGRMYYLVDNTEGLGWGPWSRVGLAARDFRIEVNVTDLD